MPAFWRLRKALRLRYDFAAHAVEPSWVKLLEDLAAALRDFDAYSGGTDLVAAGESYAIACYDDGMADDLIVHVGPPWITTSSGYFFDMS